MKPIDRIPTSKIKRATHMMGTGMKVGGNYLKFYGEKIVNPNVDKSKLDSANAQEIYKSLKSLKGSALKAAQMLSMEKNVLPKEYIDVFSLSQFSVPPLSGPLVLKTFRKYFQRSPLDLFDHFELEAVNAASIGQVHRARFQGQELAVKIQYPGVADSISSDLALLKPIALKLFQISSKDVEKYFKELESKLIEETDYSLELKQSIGLSKACSALPNLRFPHYYPQFSCDKILTMSWMEGQHLSEFTATNIDQPLANQLGQTLWDFYMYQAHQLKTLHADPHPGNFLVDADGCLIVLDFGCVKMIPDDFYTDYFSLSSPELLNSTKQLKAVLSRLDLLNSNDSPKDEAYLMDVCLEFLPVLAQPFQGQSFDFSDPTYFQTISDLGEKYARDKRLRQITKGRGMADFLYVNRSFFGLYQLLHDLKAQVNTQSYTTLLSEPH